VRLLSASTQLPLCHDAGPVDLFSLVCLRIRIQVTSHHSRDMLQIQGLKSGKAEITTMTQIWPYGNHFIGFLCRGAAQKKLLLNPGHGWG
jgi:hypothetical protein